MSGDVARATTGPATQHTRHKATPAKPVAGPARPGMPADSLTLSSQPAREISPATAKAPEPPAPETGDRLSLSPIAVEMLATTEDMTLKYTLSDRWSLSARHIYSPRHQPELRGGSVMMGEYSLSESTTLFGGAGYLPRFSAHGGGHAKAMPPGGDMPASPAMGGQERGSTSRIVGFVGVQDFRGKTWDLGSGFRLDATAHSAAMLAIAGGRGGVDARASRDLSAAFSSGALTVTRDFQNFTVKGGYGAHLDLLKTYDFATGKEDHFPLINYLHAGVEGKAGEVAYRLNGYLPLGNVPDHSGPHGLWVDPAPGAVPLPGATSSVGGGLAHGPAATRSLGFVSDPLVRAEIGMPGRAYVPDLALVASPKGFERVELSKSWAVSEKWDATVMVAHHFGPGSRESGWSGGVGLRYSFGGGRKAAVTTKHSH
jgi:hypothetical protein